MSRERDAPFVSRARVSGMRCTVRCERSALQAALRPFAPLALAPSGTHDGDIHPVCLELWRVEHGHLELGGRDQVEWIDSLVSGAEAAIGPFARGRLPLAPVGWLSAARQVALRSLHACRKSLLLDQYNELAVYVPDVVFEAAASRHTLILSMFTDSPTALWIDRAFGFGYQKGPARFEAAANGCTTVYDRRGNTLLSMVMRTEQTLTASALAQAEPGLRQPWLGRPSPGTFAESHLQRSLLSGRVMSISGALTLAAELPLGCATGRQELRPFSCTDPWPSLAFADLPVRISLPRPANRLSTAIR